MNSSQIIVLATPVFALLLGIEYAWGRHKGQGRYRLNDAVNSISLGMLSQISAVFTRLLRVGIYAAVYREFALWHDSAWWSSLYGWGVALLLYDLCYYWLHRLSHEVALLWAAHVVHHQSQAYNLSTALRQTSSGALLGWIFYVPMAVLGVPPEVFGVVALVDLLYQYWVHTELVGRLGWFDRWFCSPSNHRVHHAVNDAYIDKNYGGILIVWDRLFGSFCEEKPGEPCVYGTRKPLQSWDPLWANLEVYGDLTLAAWRLPRWGDKLRVWFKPPGWASAAQASSWPPGAGARINADWASVPTFDPPLRASWRPWIRVQLVALLTGSAVFLWFVHTMTVTQTSACFAALCVSLWALGALLQGRITLAQLGLIECAVLASATAALQWTEWHRVFKPLTMVLAMGLVVSSSNAKSTPGPGRTWLLAALAASLAGDVFLMFEEFFVPGLVSFLLAHLAYIGLLRQDAPWWPRKGTLAACLGLGATMYTILWLGGLPPALRLPVAAYVGVIALMAAQAVGRARVLNTRAAWLMAVGAGCFMLSDSLLALDKFVTPLPLARLAVLSTYYAAQLLIVGGWLRTQHAVVGCDG